MTASLYALTSMILFVVGLYGVLAGSHLLRRIIALNIMGSGVFLLLVAAADRRPESGPDPVPHALVLTGIVVAVSATALALALARRLAAPERSETDPGPAEHERPDAHTA